jgi:hypothetical protein
VSDIAWLFDGDELDEADAEKMEAAYDETGDIPDNYTRTAYVDRWDFVTACFTEQGCKDYLAVNKHNLKEHRIYAESGYRNKEWIALRKFLLGCSVPTKGGG